MIKFSENHPKYPPQDRYDLPDVAFIQINISMQTSMERKWDLAEVGGVKTLCKMLAKPRKGSVLTSLPSIMDKPLWIMGEFQNLLHEKHASTNLRQIIHDSNEHLFLVGKAGSWLSLNNPELMSYGLSVIISPLCFFSHIYVIFSIWCHLVATAVQLTWALSWNCCLWLCVGEDVMMRIC